MLDSEALSRLLTKQPPALADLALATKKGTAVVVSAMTVPEAYHDRVSRAWLSYVLSRVDIQPVTEQIALRATELLRMHGLHGHKYAIDAVVAATAMSRPGAVAVLTSDTDDLLRLCADEPRVRVVHV
ncbi:type II toxin-antitoxin system VapC family toxin [Kitasatospora sp. NPDC058965]|uniref:type II toxin-antitoxin system VapC family toxin n=1 Tax=Kitasatospora sp. NPDC058965 TaxID=3346682 RepID=UPI0036D1471F